ncbi:MAG: BlaI/MecI/CopY family transcriptional regulator [Bacteroidota bacterium]
MQPTEGELVILQVLWSSGPSTVRTVNERLNANSDKAIGYTTTLKLMQLMAEKGLVSRDTSNRTHIYAPLLPEEKAQKTLLRRFVDTTFGGSASRMVLRALGEGKASPEELAEIKRLITQLENEGNHG